MTAELTHHRPPPGTPGRRRRRPGRWVALGVTTVLAGATWAWVHGSIGSVPLREHCTATALGRSTELGPEEAGNAGIIAAVAVRRGLPSRAATIGIATAMQESKLVNLTGGDRDSIGLFQQRPSQGWGTADQVHDPVYAANAFYDVLVKIEGYQNLPITKAAQKVQRSAFPTAYAAHEPEARILASTLSGYSPAGFDCTLRAVAGGDTPTTDDSATPRAAQVLTAATRETSRRGTVIPGSGGTALRFALAGRDGERLAWALAQWAVARAGGLDITSVAVSGRQWRRDRPDATWSPTGDGPPTGTVEIRVATAR